MKRLTWINLIFGIWMLFAPFALGTSAAATTAGGPVAGNIILGILLIVSSLWILLAQAAPVGVAWFQVLCGIWLIIAPFAMGFRQLADATTNNIVVGIIALVVGLVESRGLVHRRTAA
jgi:hypothetical protein